MPRYSRWIDRHAFSIVALSLLFSVAGGYFSVLLYRNLRTSLEELLPKTARSVVDLKAASSRLESTDSLAILVFSNHPEASKRFVTDLAAEISARGGNLVSRVEYRIDREIAFFQQRKGLFLSLPDLRALRKYVRDRIDYEQELRNPLNIFRSSELPVPRFDVSGIESRFSRRIQSFTKFPDGYYANPSGTIRVVLVYMKGKVAGVDEALRLRSRIDGIVRDLDPGSYAPGMTIAFTGDVENLIEEHNALIEDLQISSVAVIVLVTLALWIFYRDPFLTAGLGFSLVLGALMTFGISYFAVGYLNANTAFLGSIVLGNGINYGIIVLGRYIEDRRKGFLHSRALPSALRGTLSATLVAALSAGLAYASLSATTFEGFRQFGLIGLLGMVLCWVSSYITLPATICLIERVRKGRVLMPRHEYHYFARAVAWVVKSAPRLLVGLSVLAVLASIYFVASFRGQIVETDFSKLRDRRSMERGSGYLSRYLDQIFGRYISPIMVLPKTRADATRIGDAFREEIRQSEKSGKESLIAAVYTIDDFVPSGQAAKIRVLREIRSMLKPRIVARLGEKDRRLAHEFLGSKNFKTYGIKDLPATIRARFRERDGAVGKLVLVEPTLDQATMANAVFQARLIDLIRRIADSVEPGAAVVGQLPVTVDIYRSIRRDGGKTTLLAFLAVVALVISVLRNSRAAAWVIGALVLGIGILFGFIFATDFRINFLNFIAFPITFGIGVDYSVNIVQRYRLDGERDILSALRSTGGVVTLASVTTIIGYGSLIRAGNQAFVSFGRLAILGEVMCLSAAILSLPAWLRLKDLKKGREEAKQLEKRTITRGAA